MLVYLYGFYSNVGRSRNEVEHITTCTRHVCGYRLHLSLSLSHALSKQRRYSTLNTQLSRQKRTREFSFGVQIRIKYPDGPYSPCAGCAWFLLPPVCTRGSSSPRSTNHVHVHVLYARMLLRLEQLRTTLKLHTQSTTLEASAEDAATPWTMLSENRRPPLA